jgi:hypothetical protein
MMAYLGAETFLNKKLTLFISDAPLVKMQFFVKSLTGTFAVNAQSGDNINNVKAMIQEREGTFFTQEHFDDLDPTIGFNNSGFSHFHFDNRL